jgi:hypothetical protein
MDKQNKTALDLCIEVCLLILEIFAEMYNIISLYFRVITVKRGTFY